MSGANPHRGAVAVPGWGTAYVRYRVVGAWAWPGVAGTTVVTPMLAPVADGYPAEFEFGPSVPSVVALFAGTAAGLLWAKAGAIVADAKARPSVTVTILTEVLQCGRLALD